MEFLTFWHWFVLGLMLIIAETLGASGFLVSLGLAAGATGFLVALTGASWEWQLICFSILCVGFSVAWWYLLTQRIQTKKISLLNQPMASMLGCTTTLIQSIEDGRGKIRINDVTWFVTGPDLPIGTKIKIVEVKENTLLVVEPLHVI